MSKFVFDHVNISVDRNSKAADFFQNVLGFDSGYRPPFPFDGKWLYEGEQALIHVTDLPDEGEQTNFGHIAFKTGEAAASVVERIESLDLNYRQTVIPEDGEVQTFVNLNGLVVEIISPSDKENTEEKNYELPTF